MRHSKQRDIVLKVMRENFIHPTAKQVLELAQKDFPDIGIATVYRNLNQLVESGHVRKISLPGEVDRFDGNLSEHHHIVCRNCGMVFDFDYPLENELARKMEKELGMTDCDCRISVSGLCKNCSEKNVN